MIIVIVLTRSDGVMIPQQYRQTVLDDEQRAQMNVVDVGVVLMAGVAFADVEQRRLFGEPDERDFVKMTSLL